MEGGVARVRIRHRRRHPVVDLRRSSCATLPLTRDHLPCVAMWWQRAVLSSHHAPRLHANALAAPLAPPRPSRSTPHTSPRFLLRAGALRPQPRLSPVPMSASPHLAHCLPTGWASRGRPRASSAQTPRRCARSRVNSAASRQLHPRRPTVRGIAGGAQAGVWGGGNCPVHEARVLCFNAPSGWGACQYMHRGEED